MEAEETKLGRLVVVLAMFLPWLSACVGSVEPRTPSVEEHASEAQGPDERQDLVYVDDEHDADVVVDLVVTIPGVFKKAYSLPFRRFRKDLDGTVTVTTPPREYYDSMPLGSYFGGGISVVSASPKQAILKLSYYWGRPEHGPGELNRNITVPFSDDWVESTTRGLTVKSRFRKSAK